MATFEATVLRKGQITLPKELREALGLREGDKLLISVVEGEIRATRAELVPEADLWFYSRAWQERIGRAEEDVAAGRVRN